MNRKGNTINPKRSSHFPESGRECFKGVREVGSEIFDAYGSVLARKK